MTTRTPQNPGPPSPESLCEAARLMRTPVADFCRLMKIPIPSDLPVEPASSLPTNAGDVGNETTGRVGVEQRADVSVLLSDWVIPDHTFNSREGGHRVHVLRSADWQVEPQLGHAEVDPSVLDVDAPKAVPLDYASSWLSISSSLHGSAGDSANDIFDREFSFPATAEMPSIVTAPERASYQPQTTMTSRSKSSHAFSNYSSSASSSSWVIQTPATNTDRSSSALSTDRIKDEAATAVAPEESEKNARGAPNHGPCSRVWNLPAKTRRKRQTIKSAQKQKYDLKNSVQETQRRRAPFSDERTRQETALTRKNRSCIRCRMLRNRCKPDPADPTGVCINCRNISRPILCQLPCLRWIITDSSLYREQDKPYQYFSTRWQNMDLVDITTWATTETKHVEISQIFLDAPYTVEVREFVPVAGDKLFETWTSDGVVKSHSLPRYALADMRKTATLLERFIDCNIGTYIKGAVGTLDHLLWFTYMFAFIHVKEAKTLEERELIQNCFRLWVGCRKTSNPHHIYGADKLGAEVVDDTQSIFHNVVPMPVIMIAQMECIMYTRVLRPMAAKVLRMLDELVKRNKPQYWLTIYLTTFILLHSCSMITKRDWETARQYHLREDFANPESISKHQIGLQTILAHFHYLNKGVYPFQLSHHPPGRKELARIADLNEKQIDFVHRTACAVSKPSRQEEIRKVRKNRDFRHDLYWVSQLYDKDWKPGPIA